MNLRYLVTSDTNFDLKLDFRVFITPIKFLRYSFWVILFFLKFLNLSGTARYIEAYYSKVR